MEIIVKIFVFCIVLFLYIHIYFHLKTSDDLEVYEIEQPSKEKLEEICDIKQPVVFNFNNSNIDEMCVKDKINLNYNAFDVKVRNVKSSDKDIANSEMYMPLTFAACLELLKNDTDEKYITENNNDFLEESALIKIFRHNDEFLRPAMVSTCIYDYMMGSSNTKTPLRYDVNYRNYYYVTEGSITVKITPSKNYKYLSAITDYDNCEVRSLVDPWDSGAMANHGKVNFLEMTVKKGDVLFIPAYWWYSIKFNEGSSVCVFKYRTYMNTIAISPYLALCTLQRHNVKREIVKKAEINSTKQHEE
tara:strand:+ start:15 stop:923 length:909 start_codon:yes stop_codon:yes gene_type:complete